MRGSVIGLAVCVAAVAALASAGRLGARDGAAYAALHVAYGLEMDARLRYLACAESAEREGRTGIACLFGAVALAESVHATRHLVALERLGPAPRWSPEGVTPLETMSNLRGSLANERREHAVLYSQLAGLARAECEYDALASMNYARSAEATHAGLFATALEGIAGSTPGPALASLAPIEFEAPPAEPGPIYHVCLGDGSVFTEMPRACPNCGTSSAHFVAVACGGSR